MALCPFTCLQSVTSMSSSSAAWNPYATRLPGGFVGKSPLGWALRVGVLGAGVAFAGVMQGVYERMYDKEAALNEHLKVGCPGSPLDRAARVLMPLVPLLAEEAGRPRRLQHALARTREQVGLRTPRIDSSHMLARAAQLKSGGGSHTVA